MDDCRRDVEPGDQKVFREEAVNRAIRSGKIVELVLIKTGLIKQRQIEQLEWH